MRATRIPERVIKRRVTAYLSNLKLQGVPVYYDMPVPHGYGKSGLDYYGAIYGFFFAIETKADGEWLTPLQRDTALAILRGYGNVFVISTDEGLEAFKAWVTRVTVAFARRTRDAA